MNEKLMKNAHLIVDVERPWRTYLEIGDKRYIFVNGEYDGWYIP